MKNLSISRLVIAFFSLFLLASPVKAANGSLAGTVVLDDGNPLGGAQVLFYKIRDARSDDRGRFIPLEPGYDGSATSRVDGTFLAENIPAGNYIVCAAGNQANQLRSCDWGGGRTDAKVGSASATSNVVLKVQTGAVLTINISDPQGKIVVQDIKGINARETNVAIGVMTKLGYYAAKLAGRSGSIWSYSVAVPIGMPVSLFLDSKLNIVDSNARSLAKLALSSPVSAMDSSGISVNLGVE